MLGAQTQVLVEPEPGRWVRTGTGSGTATATLTPVADRIYLYPFLPHGDLAADRAAINVATAAAGASARILFYDSDARGRPASLLHETADLGCATVGAKEAGVALELRKGRQVWIGARVSTAAVTVSAWQPSDAPDLDTATAAATVNKTLVRAVPHAASAPDAWTYAATDASPSLAPAIWLRAG